MCLPVVEVEEEEEVVFGRWDDMWLCLSRAEARSDIICAAPGQLM